MSSAGWYVTVKEREAFWEKKQESTFGKLVDKVDLFYSFLFQFMITGGNLQDSKDALHLAQTNGILILLLPPTM